MPQIKDSLYEQLNPLTTVAGQHFVDDFSGDTPDVMRWGFGYQNSTTGNVASMADEIDGGILLTTGSDDNDQALYMSFMAGTDLDGTGNATLTTIPIRPFESGLANMICTVRNNTPILTMGNFFAGFSESGRGDAAGDNMAGVSAHKSYFAGYFTFLTSNSGGGQGTTNSDLTRDTAWHTYNFSSNVTADPTPAGAASKMSIDGVLKATRTGAIGYFNENVAPIFATQRTSTTSGGASMNIRYCEAWNEV